MSLVKMERDKAYLCAKDAEARARQFPFRVPVRIRMELRRVRMLDNDNAVASLKHYRDGLCRAVLPLGDGPKTPYVWEEPIQVGVPDKSLEGVAIYIEVITKDEPPGYRPFSGNPR